MSRYIYICPECRLHTDELQEPECPRCGNEDTCPPVDVTAFATLAANLGVAGALCESYRRGEERSDPWPDADGRFYPGYALEQYASVRAEVMRLREEQR